MLPKEALSVLSDCLIFSGISALAPALFYLLLRGELGVSVSAALTAAVLACAAVLARLRPARAQSALPWAGACAAAFVSGTWVLPGAGAGTALTAGLMLAAAGALLALRTEASIRSPAPFWLWGLAAGAAPAWVRCLSLLVGNPLYASSWALSAMALGIAPGLWLGRRLSALPEPRIPAGVPAACAGFFGVLILYFLRFIGLNSGEAERLILPLISLRDVFFIAGQSCAALGLWSMILAAASSVRSEENRPWGSSPAAALSCLAGPWAAAALIPRLGPARTAAVFNCLIMVYGLLRAGPQALRERPGLAKALGAALLIAAWLGLALGDPFHDIWLNRLNAAYPGGRFLTLTDDGKEALGVYRFSTGATVLLREGLSDFHDELASKREAHIPLMMLASPKRVLLAGVRSPFTLSSAMTHGVETDLVDPDPGIKDILMAQAPSDWRLPGPGVTFIRSPLRRYLEKSRASYDLILHEPPGPLQSPEAAFQTTLEALQALRSRLKPEGLLAMRLPRPYFAGDVSRVVKTLQQAFKFVGILDLPGCPLLISADRPIDASPSLLIARRSLDIDVDDFHLMDYVNKEMRLLQPIVIREPPLIRAQKDGRALNAFPLGRILRGEALHFELPARPVDKP